jgi:predicted MFS family arabinose efflux permease
MLGWINSIFGTGLVAGTLVASRIPGRLRTAVTLTVLVGMNAFGVLAYVGTDRLTVVAVAAPLWGIIIGMMAPLHRTLVQVNSPDRYVGRIMGVDHIHSELGHLLPLAFAPFLAGAFGVQRTLLYAGAMLVVVALFFARPAIRLDHTRTLEVPRTGLADPEEEPKSLSH